MSEQLTVLVVDDDWEIVTAATLRLHAAGYRTRTASDGESGVALAAECHPDVILLDVRMPGMDGLTALRKLKERSDTKDIPVVMLSASNVDRQAALDAGARFFLKKPYQGEMLLRAVASARVVPGLESHDPAETSHSPNSPAVEMLAGKATALIGGVSDDDNVDSPARRHREAINFTVQKTAFGGASS